ncbi:hypothetical protein C8R44DRAFT_816949 [Mycena epipterygia]|nr:hypothetical protein C8R44DRAFT_816949 [Mycena epipterygia]
MAHPRRSTHVEVHLRRLTIATHPNSADRLVRAWKSGKERKANKMTVKERKESARGEEDYKKKRTFSGAPKGKLPKKLASYSKNKE